MWHRLALRPAGAPLCLTLMDCIEPTHGDDRAVRPCTCLRLPAGISRLHGRPCLMSWLTGCSPRLWASIVPSGVVYSHLHLRCVCSLREALVRLTECGIAWHMQVSERRTKPPWAVGTLLDLSTLR